MENEEGEGLFEWDSDEVEEGGLELVLVSSGLNTPTGSEFTLGASSFTIEITPMDLMEIGSDKEWSSPYGRRRPSQY